MAQSINQNKIHPITINHVKNQNEKNNIMEKTTLAFMPNQNEIKALTWKQPFAELMLHGKIETRTWQTHYRGWVLICASKQSYCQKQIDEIMGRRNFHNYIDLLFREGIKEKNFINGNAIAIGRLVDCRQMTPEDAAKCFVEYRPGLWCHIYEDVQAIEPFPWKGAQGWRTLTPEQKRQIKFISNEHIG